MKGNQLVVVHVAQILAMENPTAYCQVDGTPYRVNERLRCIWVTGVNTLSSAWKNNYSCYSVSCRGLVALCITSLVGSPDSTCHI